MTFRGYGGGGPPSASSSYFGPHGPGDDRKSVASNVGAGGFRPPGYSESREHDLVRSSGQENWNQSTYSAFKRSEDMLRVTVGNSLYVPPGSGGSAEANNGASNWGRGGGPAQFERTVESLGSLPGVPNDWNVPQPDFRQRNRAPAVPEGGMRMADSGIDDRWSGRAEAAGSRGDQTRRGGPVPPAHSRDLEREIGASHSARIDAGVSDGFAAVRTSEVGAQRDKHSAVWRSADTGLYAQQSVASDHLGSGAGLSAPKSILKTKSLGQSAIPAIATERVMPTAGGSDSLGHHHHVGSAAPDGSTARAALQAQSLLVAAAAAAASGTGSSGGGSAGGGSGGAGGGGGSMSARAQVFDYGHSKPDVLFGNKATAVPSGHQSSTSSGLQGGPSSTGPGASVGVTDGSGQTVAGRDLMQDPLFDSIIKSMGVDFDPKKKLQERARELEQQVEAARRKRREKTEEEMARQFGINKTASFLEGGDLDIGTVLGSSAALVTAAVRRSTDNDARSTAHHRRDGAGAQSSVPELRAADAPSIRDSHPDQESGQSRRGGASPSRKSQLESGAGGVHVRDGRNSSDSGRSGAVGDRYDARLAGSLQREAAAGFASQRSPSGAQSSHYATRSSLACDVETVFPSSSSSEGHHDRRNGRDMADRRLPSDSHHASDAASSRTKGDRSNRSDAVEVEVQRHLRVSESNRVGSSSSSIRAPTPGGCETLETSPSTGALTREEHEKLKVEMEDRRRRLRLLEGELDKLRRQQNELMRKHQQRGGSVGRRDPFIDENTRLQEDISKQISQLRKTAEANERALAARLALSESAFNVGPASTKGMGARSDASATLTVQASGGSGESWSSGKSTGSRDGRDSGIDDDIIERLSSHFSRDQAKSLSAALGDASAATALFRMLLQVHPSIGESAVPTLKQPFEDRLVSKTSSSSAGIDGSIGRQPSRSAASGSSPPAEGVVYEYYDSSAHWCKPCNVELPTLSALLEHLASDAHQQALEQPERPWAAAVPRAPALPSKTSKKESATIIKLPLKGSEFVVPAPHAFYCRLCSSFAGDQRCMEAHIKSSDHYETYKKYTSDNPFYERRYTLDREASARSRKRRQEEDARLADRAKRQRLDDELVNKKLEALKTRHRQTCGDSAFTTAKPDGAAAENVPEATAKEPALNESPMPDAGGGCGSKTQRLDLQHGVIKKEPGDVANLPLADAAEPSRDGVSTSKKMRLDDAGSNEASAVIGTKERQSAVPSNERCETAAESMHVAPTSDVGLPISVVVGKKAVSSTASAAAQGVAAHLASAAALAGATVGVANAPLMVASGTDRQQRSPLQAKATRSSDAVVAGRSTAASTGRRAAAVAPVAQSTGSMSAGSGRGRLVDGSDSRGGATTAAAAAARSTTASTKPARSPAQPGSLSASGAPQGPPASQTAKPAGTFISPSSNRALPTAAAAAETGSKAASASIGAVATSGARPAVAVAAAVPAISAAKTVGKSSSSVQETSRAPSSAAGSVPPPAAVEPAQSRSSVGTSTVHAAASGAASPKPSGLAAGCSRPSQQQHQTRSATTTAAAAAGSPVSVTGGGGKPADALQPLAAVAAVSGGIAGGNGPSLATAPPRAAVASSTSTSLPTPPPVVAQQPPAAESGPPPSDSSTCRAPEPASSSSTAISQSAKVAVPVPITASQSAVDSKPGMPVVATLSATTTAAADTATAGGAMPAVDRTASRPAPPSAKGSLPAAPTAMATTAAGQPAAKPAGQPAAKPGAPTAAASTPPDKPQQAAANVQPIAVGGRDLGKPVSAASVATTSVGMPSNRTGATAVSADRALTTAAGSATVVSKSDNGQQPAAPPAANAPAARQAAAISVSASADKSLSKPPAAAHLPTADVPLASGTAVQSKRPSSSPAMRQAIGGVSHTSGPSGGSRPAAAAAAVKPPSAASSVDDGAAAKVAVAKAAGAMVSSADASDLEGDGSVSGADEGSADELSMDGDFEILDEYEELEEHT